MFLQQNSLNNSESTDPIKRLKFSIQDSGIGIKKDDICKLFKVFGKIE